MTAVTVAEGSEEGESDSGGQGTGLTRAVGSGGSVGMGLVADGRRWQWLRALVTEVAQGSCSAGCGKPGLGCGLGGWGRKKYEVN